MPKYKVFKSFPSRDRIVRGQILVDPNFKNLNSLVRGGYLKPVPDDGEIVEEITPLPDETLIETPVSEIPETEIAAPANEAETAAAPEEVQLPGVEADAEVEVDAEVVVSLAAPAAEEVKTPKASLSKTSKPKAAAKKKK